VCAAGYGKTTGSSTCEACSYGSFNLGTSDSCLLCPETTFNDFVGEGYTSYGITFRTGLKGPESCVPRRAQLPKPVGDRFALPDNMLVAVSVAPTTDNKFVKGCVEACPADQCCIAEIEKSDKDITCKHARLAPVSSDTRDKLPRMYYKLPPSEIAAASKDSAKAKTMASGIYAICSLEKFEAEAAAGKIGTSPDPTKVEEAREYIAFNAPGCKDAEECKKACAADAACWGFIWHPVKGFALRGGESWLGGRSFFVSPDANGDSAAKIAGFDMNALAW
jgi:hypothetical protein